MTEQDYALLVKRLASPRTHLSFISNMDMETAFEDAARSTRQLDNIKRRIFYGVEPTSEVIDPCTSLEYVHQDVLHSILGIATEAGELLERLSMMQVAPDVSHRENLIEEIGDTLWYVTLLCTALGVDQSHVRAVNAAKLMKRFPELFSQQAALSRNLQGEQLAMRLSDNLG
jgi:NTP pyrophosphatase (non-canonical NTP hydrolase)